MPVRVSMVAAGRRHSVACLSDGTAVAVGHDGTGECQVTQWKGIVAVALRVKGLRPVGVRNRPVLCRAGG